MNWLTPILDRLARQGPIGYGAEQQPATEPTAIAALALLAQGRTTDALPHLEWLEATQQSNGAVPVRRQPPWPHWTTSLASLAWTLATKQSPSIAQQLARPLAKSAAWMLECEGEAAERQPQFGHDSTLVGWPWVAGTHSWLEPTAFHVLALTARGWSSHARVVTGRRVIADRLLTTGGANYGNTVVLGQQLLPHVQPSGIAMLALAGDPALQQDNSDRPAPVAQVQYRIRATLDYLRRQVGQRSTPASLCWGLMGLAAFDEAPDAASDWLEQAAQRKLLSAHHAALIAMTSMMSENPLIALNFEMSS